jgi:hypothetical protein
MESDAEFQTSRQGVPPNAGPRSWRSQVRWSGVDHWFATTGLGWPLSVRKLCTFHAKNLTAHSLSLRGTRPKKKFQLEPLPTGQPQQNIVQPSNMAKGTVAKGKKGKATAAPSRIFLQNS